jgi:hypothetical protein
MGWEQRGNNRYYYKKQREGSRVKSIYVGRGEIANLISQFQSGSSVIEKLVHRTKTEKEIKSERAVFLFEDAIQLLTQGSLLTAGFHTHHRQWRRKRQCWLVLKNL